MAASRASPNALSRRARACSSVASLRARPTWPPLTEAAHWACSASMPSRSTNTCAMAATEGVTSAT
ncbi:Uncharacterised protein [Mycobacteroides abscessus subsp. abscessus]|nr:Uncharacterised protein [Mycobacteroides abscessus subsp. abscessus]SKW34419.1 Uncharacterised protein [Mycobacteroides abscessus subsp. abscessus]